MTQSLRGRLLIGVISLVVVGLLISDVATYVLFPIPVTEMQTRVTERLQFEGLISLGVVAASAVLALLIIGISRRPGEKMGAVAKEMAAGALTRRVEPAAEKSEIGRLGLALN